MQDAYRITYGARLQRSATAKWASIWFHGRASSVAGGGGTAMDTADLRTFEAVARPGRVNRGAPEFSTLRSNVTMRAFGRAHQPASVHGAAERVGWSLCTAGFPLGEAWLWRGVPPSEFSCAGTSRRHGSLGSQPRESIT
jgi:hypothetical protein